MPIDIFEHARPTYTRNPWPAHNSGSRVYSHSAQLSAAQCINIDKFHRIPVYVIELDSLLVLYVLYVLHVRRFTSLISSQHRILFSGVDLLGVCV